jgi:hypothetical protein
MRAFGNGSALFLQIHSDGSKADRRQSTDPRDP